MEKNNKIKVIIPFHNPGDYLDMCINSILTQDYENYDVLFIDDCSTDGSYEKIPACNYKIDEKGEPIKDEKGDLIIENKHPILEVTKCNKINAWRSNSRITALGNIHNGILNFSEDEDDIIFILYGDDWLVNKKVLQKINEIYNSTNCLLTYGSSKLSDGKKNYSAEYNQETFKHLRRSTPKFSHPITFKKSLYTKLCDLDPKFYHFTDNNGKWLTTGSNFALAYPLMEIAGFQGINHIKEVIYVYNIDNPLNSEKLNADLYYETQDIIINKKPIIK